MFSKIGGVAVCSGSCNGGPYCKEEVGTLLTTVFVAGNKVLGGATT